jgi:F-type H+-transporting ATPase subunit gamma
MAKARKILKRVKAVKSIRTVTKTMEMVSTARFRRSHNRVAGAKPYVDRLAETVRNLASRGIMEDGLHPLLRSESKVRRDALLVITSNRGLAGAYNSSVLRLAMERIGQIRQSGYEVLVFAVGKRGIQSMKFHGQKVAKAYTEFNKAPTVEQAQEIANSFMDMFIAGEISGLEVAYMQFVSSGSQKPAIAPVLPLSEMASTIPQWATASESPPAAYELIPSVEEIMRRLLPMSVRMKIYQCFLEADVSEQMMRIAAMRAATDSADDMIHDLTVQYNRTRQGQITTELAEIMGGRVGLE